MSYSLTQQNQALQRQVQILQASAPSASKKRKLVVDESRGLAKKTRLVESVLIVPTSSVHVDFDSLASDQPGMSLRTRISPPLTLSDTTRPGLTALRTLRNLHSMLKGHMFGVEAANLAACLNSAADALTVIINTMPVQSRSSIKARTEYDQPDHFHTVTAVARAFTTLLHALQRLSDFPQSDQLVGNAVFHCAKVLDSTLTTIELCATYEAKTRVAAQLAMKPSNKPQRPPVKTPSLSTNQALMNHLTNFLLAVLSHLDTTRSSHASLLEALVFHLLTRIGEILHLTTFSGPRNDSVDHEIRNLPPSEEHMLDPLVKLDRTAMTIEAPYMIALLRKALAMLPPKMRRRLPEGLDAKFYLVPAVLNKLQRTLVDCVFGSNTRGSDASEDVLRMPELRGLVDDAADIENMATRNAGGVEGGFQDEERRADWFEGQLWGLLGWNILGREKDL